MSEIPRTADCCICSCSLANQPHSVLQWRSLSVSACTGRVWRLRTTFHESLQEFE